MDDAYLYASPSSSSLAAYAHGNPFSPSPSSQLVETDGYRITWGPSASSILAELGVTSSRAAGTSSFSGDKSRFSAVKRSSGFAGLGSPTRLGTASTTGATSPNGPSSLLPPSDLTKATSSTTASSSSSNVSRFSKRRRRFPLPAASKYLTPALRGGCNAGNDESQRTNSSTMTDTDMDESTMSMFGELTRRLEAKRLAGQQEGQAGQQAANDRSAHPPQLADREEEYVRECRAGDGKGKGRAQPAAACSPIMEVDEKSNGNGSKAGTGRRDGTSDMDIDKSSGSAVGSTESRPVVQSKQDIPAVTRTRPVLPARRSSTSGKESYRSTTMHTIPSSPVVPLNQQNLKPLFQPPSDDEDEGHGASDDPFLVQAPNHATDNAKQAPEEKPHEPGGLKLEEDETYWDEENDKSLELVMSQMAIPPAPSQSQPSSQSRLLPEHLHAPKGRPQPNDTARDVLASGAKTQAQHSDADSTKSWAGFRKRQDGSGSATDKGCPTKSADEEILSAQHQEAQRDEGKPRQRTLSNKPLGKPILNVGAPLVGPGPGGGISKSTSAEGSRATGLQSTKGQTSTSADKVKLSSQPRSQSNGNLTLSGSQQARGLVGGGSTVRVFTKAQSETALKKAFRPPSVMNKANNLKEREKAKSGKGTVVLQQAAPYLGDDLDDIDFGDESF